MTLRSSPLIIKGFGKLETAMFWLPERKALSVPIRCALIRVEGLPVCATYYILTIFTHDMASTIADLRNLGALTSALRGYIMSNTEKVFQSSY